MGIAANWTALNRAQKNTFAACFLGWTLDAFDFFLLTVCLPSIATEFHVDLATMANALFWTLVMRPVGAALFGAMAERYGRRPTLMLNIVAFSVFELGSAFAPGIGSFMVLRALFGVAMGGEWGVGAALAFETLPAKGRGFFSGLLQEGYVVGNLLAGLLQWLLLPHLHGTGHFTPWRVLFMIGALPSLLAFYLQFHVEESPVWLEAKRTGRTLKNSFEASKLKEYLPSFLFLVLMMAAFTAFSHGTQDLYPSFLKRDKGLFDAAAGKVLVVANLGALFGGICCGTISERLGRRKTIMFASLLALPMIPLWAFSHTVVMLAVGGFLMQFMVQGAWGVVPAYLNELSPAPVRAVFPGFAYQLGNLLMSKNGNVQATLAKRFPGGLRTVLAGTVVVVALVLTVVTSFGKEKVGAELGAE
ncbi:MFS transporter [Granulicella tundricola]|uniref:Major facilitator superfamily MFS_1 n=1 Tax=Granulicella tundricola (strain ATCC BAA-1859 / DSM 23138 / MP5ACTX9) TaxID=1198114 RepID=E8X1Y4_GRATM|nr:MFS transporter [Granulicella tundricola]ADW69145.1 major facilitator superfamily MFS_1 [Granulicella tundricola MP5ACTX9]